jgi:hypothetical protein
MLEADIHRAVMEHWRALKLPDTLVATIPSMGAMGQWGLTSGLPDLLVLAPGLPIGFIELKRDKGKLSTAQAAFKALCDRIGVKCAVCWGRDDPIRVLEEWGVVRRAAR